MFKSIVFSCIEMIQALTIIIVLMTLITDHCNTCGSLSTDMSQRSTKREREIITIAFKEFERQRKVS